MHTEVKMKKIEPLRFTAQSHHDYQRNGGELRGKVKYREQEPVKPSPWKIF